MYIFEPACLLLTLCALEKFQNKVKIVDQIPFYIKDVCCTIFSLWKKPSPNK